MDTRFFRRRAAGVLAALLVAFCFAGSGLVRAAEPSLCPSSERDSALAPGHEARRQGHFHRAAAREQARAIRESLRKR